MDHPQRPSFDETALCAPLPRIKRLPTSGCARSDELDLVESLPAIFD